jgi:hypothetical protein
MRVRYQSAARPTNRESEQSRGVSKKRLLCRRRANPKRSEGSLFWETLAFSYPRMKRERHRARLIRGWGASAGVEKDPGSSASLGMTHFTRDDTKRRRHKKCAGWLL